MGSLRLTYNSSINDIRELNSSFDVGVLQICYSGANRNKTYFSKETLEKCIPTMYNCPVAANYHREDGSIGGHDVEFISDYDNQFRMVNITQPVGVVPESADVYFKEVVEDDGTVNEYLCASVILWKRQEAYKAIKENGITHESMEVNVLDGAKIDDVYVVNNFEFTAFTLLGDDIEPCFESASLQTYSIGSDFKAEFAEMMSEFKETFNLKATSNEVENKISEKGGCHLEDKNLETFEVTEEVEEVIDPVEEVEEVVDENFALNSGISEGIYTAFDSQKVMTEWGEVNHYCIADFDIEAGMVYAWDVTDWLLYGFGYEMNGDNVVVDFDSKKRMKYTIVEFNEGEDQGSPFASTYSDITESVRKSNESLSELETKYQNASEKIESMSAELDELRQFKANIEADSDKAQREAIFEQFEDLKDVEEFNALIADSSSYDLEALEEKCFAIRGRNIKLNFSAKEVKTPKLPVGQKDRKDEDTPYGGVVERYLKR